MSSSFISTVPTADRALLMVVAHWHVEVDEKSGGWDGGGRHGSRLMDALMGIPEGALVYAGSQSVLGIWPSRYK